MKYKNKTHDLIYIHEIKDQKDKTKPQNGQNTEMEIPNKTENNKNNSS